MIRSMGGSSPSTNMFRSADEPRRHSLTLAGLAAVEGTGSRPGSQAGSRPTSRGSTAGKSPTNQTKGLSRDSFRLPDEAGSPAQTGRSSHSRLPQCLNETPTANNPVVSVQDRMRDRMKQSLSINTEPLVKQRPKAFHRLKDGETVDKFYEVGEQIYDGGPRGRVLKAFRRTDRMEVVIKVRAKKSDKTGERAWREVMTQLHSMRHQSPHVLDIFEILEDEREFFVVMPMCEGGELFNFLVTEAEVPESECKRIIREILIAIGHLHENNLIHRDVKPENILFDIDKDMVGSPKSVKLIDFDTCMEWSPKTPKSRSFVGTPGYIAPEALLGEATPASDLWSVGVICYILMTGETPWTTIDSLEDGTVGGVGAARMYNTLQNAVVDWESEPWPDFPLARDLCQKLMAFDSEKRVQSVQEALAHPWLAK